MIDSLTDTPESCHGRPIPRKEQTLYDRSGVEYLFHAVVSDTEWVVHPIMESTNWEGDREIYPADSPCLMNPRNLFEKRPVNVVQSDISALAEQARVLREEITQLRHEKYQFDREVKGREERLKKHDKLRMLDDYLLGKINFLVFRQEQSGKFIKTLKECETGDRYARHKLPLLTLFGETGGELNWKMNRYSDGSGADTEVILCETEDEAIAVIDRWIAEAVDAWQKSGDHATALYAKSLAITHNRTYPDEIERFLRRVAVKRAEDIVAQARTSLQDRIDNLNKARAYLIEFD